MAQYKPVTKAADDPFRGPSAIPELNDVLRGSGEDLAGFQDYWVRHSGVHPESAAAHTHRALISVYLHMIVFDQLNVPALASAEALCRQVLRIHRAVKSAPKNPDFSGLDVMTHSRLDSGGSLFTGDFAKWTAEEQKTEAFTMKQLRLVAEEQTMRHKARDANAGGGAAKK